jgi:hypothetical protein
MGNATGQKTISNLYLLFIIYDLLCIIYHLFISFFIYYPKKVLLFCERLKSANQQPPKINVYCDNMGFPRHKMAGIAGI